jgi:hypothetical protein
MANVTASGTLHGHQLKDMPALNPGDWFGKTWLLEIGGSYWPLFLIVEADTAQDAIDELADDEQYGHHIVVDDADLGDYPEDHRHYGPSGQVLDLDHLLIHGQEGTACPFPCTYHGEGLPEGGMTPADYCEEADQ